MKNKNSVVYLSTIGFTLLFAVWLMFGILAIPIQKEFNLSEIEFGWLTAIAILNGALWRLVFGIIADKYGGKKIFLVIIAISCVFCFLISYADSFNKLILYAFFLGIAGNSFSVGIAWNSAWFGKNEQGYALGLFGAGNVGASVTKIIGPTLIVLVPATGLLNGNIPGGWRFIPFLYGILLIFMFFILLFFTPKIDLKPAQNKSFIDSLQPLKQMRVWRFSLYYIIVFGAYVGLSVWLPKYYVDNYHLELRDAALLTALFIFPASLLRPLGGKLSDLFGPRKIMYIIFGVMLICLLFLGAPEGHIVLYLSNKYHPTGTVNVMRYTLGVIPFTVLIFFLGVCMGIGKAAVYKYIPEYFPKDVGSVGGLVGCIGALGGFFFPITFSYVLKYTAIPQTSFFILFIITLISFIWLHITVIKMMSSGAPHLKKDIEEPVNNKDK